MRRPIESAQYTPEAYTNVVQGHGIPSGLSRPRNYWDNAVADSFFATLKSELVYRRAWPTRAAARSAIFDYIDAFCNPRRLHSTLGNLSPAAYETHHSLAAQSA